MFEPDIIGVLDHNAINLDKKAGDSNIFEFDLTLWNLLKILSKENPRDVSNRFPHSQNIIDLLATASEKQLQRLASSVMLSFKLETCEKIIISKLAETYDPVIFINHKVNEFDAAYWLLLKRMALQDVAVAKERFGVSTCLAEQVAKVTDNHLRYVTTTTASYFSLRCKSAVIREILAASDNDITNALFKKFKQSLQSRRWR